MAEKQPETAPSVARGSRSPVGPDPDSFPSSNPPRQDTLPADAIATLPDGSEDPGAAALQRFRREDRAGEEAQGHRGVKPNPTPNRNYTLAGVNAGLPTPETIVREDTTGGLSRA